MYHLMKSAIPLLSFQSIYFLRGEAFADVNAVVVPMEKGELNESANWLLDKYRGCMIGGAVGDALGYTVDFMHEEAIKRRYGKNGITAYELTEGIAQISDDTQMTLFTANGLLLATTRGRTRGIMAKYSDYIALCYTEWMRTQTEEYPLGEKYPYTWLINLPELFQRRSPALSCFLALSSYSGGTNAGTDQPISAAKGCAGVTRVAPIGIYFGKKQMSIENVDRLAAESAAITHGHDLGYIPAAGLVHIIHLVSHDKDISLMEAVDDMIATMPRLFSDAPHIDEYTELMHKAVSLAKGDLLDTDAIHMLGEGWSAEEALAIAIYCSLKHERNFRSGVVAAVNHNGDSDSTGAITGNILGAYLGLSAIPEQYLENLELQDVILELADDLYHDCRIGEYCSARDEIWEQKYVYKTYRR